MSRTKTGKTEVAGSDSGGPISSGLMGRLPGVLQTRRTGALDVNSVHGVHETAAGGDTARGDHLQCADLDESARASGQAIPYGGRRD